ncbi:SDR family oxidoreductase [Candidatus Uabimicrobium amorphum]|uniref:Short-chain dehydrogenase/reductase n=1 Tax=Uabimicrobium amorphum TaxID=2596890 RepID=A0A5S9ITL5_UABAM|nr:SDR family oxidoreductase [Candidatus Uabimicrobium amorphum]BBM87704.1 short-chain dehydrogenase/reductase [Candidatus Uabimicrobium amorphum]
MKYIVVTGASTGIGKNLCQHLIAEGYFVFGSVRRAQDAEKLSEEFPQRFSPLVFDVTNREDVEKAVKEVQNIVGDNGLFCLINNAGIAIPGPLMHIPVDEFRRQFDVNVFGVLDVTQAFLPLLGAELPQKFPPGKIINVSSVGGKLFNPFIGAYNSSKHALECMSDVLRIELNIYGIHVVIIEPGAIKTPIWEKSSGYDLSIYDNTHYAQNINSFQKLVDKIVAGALEPDYISRKVVKILRKKKPKARYALPDRPISGWIIPRLLPTRVLDKAMIKFVGLQKREK